MFTHGLKSLETIPPTENALFQHTRRTLLTAAYICKQSLTRDPNISDPGQWGWEWKMKEQKYKCPFGLSWVKGVLYYFIVGV